VLTDGGLRPTVVEPFPAAVPSSPASTATAPAATRCCSLTLDVVPAEPGGWTHDPFGGDLVDGYVWGRGAIDMKSMVAMEVFRSCAASPRAAQGKPAAISRRPDPGLRRDVIFCSSGRGGGGCTAPTGWSTSTPTGCVAAGALNEGGRTPRSIGGVRFYPIQVAEKGFVVYKIRVKGRWGHGSIPTPDNAAVLAAQIVMRLAEPGRRA